MGARMRWRQALAAVMGAVAVGAALLGGVQALGEAGDPGGTREPSVDTVGPGLPGASDPDAIVPPAGAVARPPGFAPSAVVPVPLPAPRSAPAERSRPPRAPTPPGSPARTTTPSRRPGSGREPTSGESQYEYGCRRGYITEGC